jgi:hypothetical protein
MWRAGNEIEQHASVPLRRVRAGELRWEKFLYELKAGPAGGLRPPSGPATTRRAPGAGPALALGDSASVGQTAAHTQLLGIYLILRRRN